MSGHFATVSISLSSVLVSPLCCRAVPVPSISDIDPKLFLDRYCNATQAGSTDGERKRSHILSNQDDQRSVKELPSDKALLAQRLEEQKKIKQAEDDNYGVSDSALGSFFDTGIDDDDF